MNGKLIIIGIPAKDAKSTAGFYSKLLGVEFARSVGDSPIAYFAPLSDDGLIMYVHQGTADHEAVMCGFAVDNLDAAVKEIEKEGGKVVAQRLPLTISEKILKEYHKEKKAIYGDSHTATSTSSLGTALKVQDSEGNLLTLIQLEPHAHATFKVGEHRRPHRAEQMAGHQRMIKLGKKLEHAEA